jgi:hypothetical protein
MLPHFGEFRNSFSPAPLPLWQRHWASGSMRDRVRLARLRPVHHATGLQPERPSRPSLSGARRFSPVQSLLARPWWTTRAGHLLHDLASTQPTPLQGLATAMVGLRAPDSSIVMAPKQRGSAHGRGGCLYGRSLRDPAREVPRTYGRSPTYLREKSHVPTGEIPAYLREKSHVPTGEIPEHKPLFLQELRSSRLYIRLSRRHHTPCRGCGSHGSHSKETPHDGHSS